MAYRPIAYFSGDPSFKLAIPQEAWYEEFKTPSVGGNSTIGSSTQYVDFDGISRFLKVKGTDFSETIRMSDINTYIKLFDVTEKKALSIKIINRGMDNIPNYNIGYYWAEFEWYWTDRTTGVHEIVGRNSISTLVTYSNGTTEKIPCYITALADDEEKKCFLNCTCFNVCNPIPNFMSITSSCVNNGPYTSWRLTETKFYQEVYGYMNDYDSDPWSNAGYGETGGGDGTFDFTSDNIHLPQIPECNAVNTGFIQLFKGTVSEIRALASYMWTDSFWGAIAKLTANPMDVILSLCMYPFDIPASNRRIVQAGNVVTTVTMAVPDNQIVEVDCGSYEVPKFYGSYLDYEPFAKCEIFLPYCGMKTLSLDDIVGRTVNVKYRIDLLTGTCAVFVLVNDTVLYTFSGVCAANIPITSRGFENTISSCLNLASAGVSAFTGAGSAAMVAGFGASAASNVMQSKPTISRSGSMSGNSGFMGVQKPFFVFTTPRVAIPKGQATYTGYPIFNTYKLSDVSGYTEIEEIHLENMGRATADEISEIEKLLKGGVIL